jgi:fluoride ion exporter CrcB/FEX
LTRANILGCFNIGFFFVIQLDVSVIQSSSHIEFTRLVTKEDDRSWANIVSH